jgi:hypothetical protein
LNKIHANSSIPVLKHKILMWFPSSGFVSASNVGAKNIASSSGCAMRRHIRLSYSFGRAVVKGEPDVAESVQKRKKTGMTRRAQSSVSSDDIVV